MDAHTTIALMPDAARATTAAVDRVQPRAWHNPTPCTEWSVRDVLNHLTAEHLWAPHLLRGEELEQVGDRYDGDVLGDDPAGSWRRAVARSVLAFGSADPEGGVHTSFGRISMGEYAAQMLTDLTVHGWDLSRGAGASYEPVPDAVEVAWAYEKPAVEAHQKAGVFAAPVSTTSDNRMDQLVALLGRDPEWRSRD